MAGPLLAKVPAWTDLLYQVHPGAYKEKIP
jgi:hypothetical protein